VFRWSPSIPDSLVRFNTIDEDHAKGGILLIYSYGEPVGYILVSRAGCRVRVVGEVDGESYKITVFTLTLKLRS